MKGWEINAISYTEYKEAGTCPKCGSSKVKVEEYIGKRRKSLSFLCLDCGSGDHFDGMLESKPK